MLYLLQLVSTHQGPFSSIAVIMTKNYNDLNKDKIPKRNCIQVACSILISHSLPQVSLIPSIFTFCIKCLLYPNSYQYYPYLHHVLQCLPSQHSFSLQGSKRIQRVLDRVIWQNFKVVQPVQTCRESFLIKSGVWMSSWGLIYWNGINAAQNQIQRLFDCKMLYLLQPIKGHIQA